MVDLMQIRRRILMQSGDLPPTFRRVDYLQTSGYNARIDTGVSGADDTLQIYGDFAFLEFRQYHYIFGNLSNSTSNDMWRLIMPSRATATWITFSTNSTGDVAPRFPSGGTWETAFRAQFLVKKDYAEVTRGGETASASTTAATGGANDSTIAIGASKVDPGSTSYTTRVNLYHFKIWRGDTLIRDYIPVVRARDSKPGFYDLVNHTFSPSIGTVDFTAGND